MKNIFLFFMLFFCLAVFLCACKTAKLNKNACKYPQLTYTSDIKPIIDASCGTKCHRAEKRAGGVDLSNYDSVKAESTTSNFLGAIEHVKGITPMPKNGDKLPDSSIQKIKCWIQNGAPE